MNMIASKLNSADIPQVQEPRVLESGEADAPSALHTYLRIALRWRWVIIGATVICLMLGLIVTLLMTPKYTAAATIEIAREAEQVTKFEGVEREVGAADQEFYQTQYGLLASRTLAERVANALNLVDDQEFFEMFGAPDDPAFELENGRYPASGRAKRQRVAGETLLDNLSIDETRLSRLVDIRFTSPNPDLSKRVANAWAENFIQTNLERKVQSTAYGREQLQRQLAEYKDRLDASQRQLVTYASTEEIINLPGQTQGAPERAIIVDNLAAFNTALSEAEADRIEAEARFRLAAKRGATTEALSNPAINELRARRAEMAAEYQRMMVRFEPGYPAAAAIQSQIDDLDRSIEREERRVTDVLDASYRQAIQRRNELQAKVEGLKQDYLDLRRRSIQYNIFEQEVDTNQALYDGLLQRFKEIGVAGGIGVNNVSVVDFALTPQVPSSPRLLINLMISLLAGLMIGAALAFALEQLDEAIADPTEVERRLGLPLLGSVPRTMDETPKEALLDRKSELFDAYLAVYTSLGFTTEHGVPRSFAVTSTRPAEGKSTTALALATTLARAGKKVILVDGDMRSPSVHHLGGVDHDRGLSNFLAGDDNIDNLTFVMNDLAITAMSAGPIPPNAAELLTGNRLSVLVERLCELYDHVIIDSPPVMGLADAPLIASRVEGAIYAVESHGIRSSQVKTALNRLASANVRVFGCVLTKFEARKSYYGYGYEYGYAYGREEKEAEAA
ncbi:polysaccharide biosynthesis tyrosine autokinase [Croceibacterium sp. LX-88]|uniref:Polysaccharide biosynthesis tyrosine autokinase n=1 Tax=Croceibacterium selenioxidans TaxID=2838833 RepID=A0ABS5W1B8_9SPHN|nr:polysaccharide biosynthesis tyrosine autokinase [Croceibacterium selenioxidans]MBT2133562.1 polysaccharide biosynthesis tyrosine autokinase [Croceibacterium selenioxidans]